MSFGFMQELRAKKQQGEDLGADAQLLNESATMRLGSGLNVDVEDQGLSPAMVAVEHNQDHAAQKLGETPPPQTLGATFANEIIRRLDESDGAEGETKDNTDLRHSLGQAMDWVRERFGDETAAAASAMVLGSTRDGVNEESLGDGLLNALKFIDRNFGFAAGDAAIAKFNGGVNAEINEYFENGQNEIFYAETTPVDGSATQQLSVRTFMRVAQDLVPEELTEEGLNQKLLDELKKELDEVAELTDLTAQIEAEMSPAKASMQTAMAAYTQAPTPASPQFADTVA